jgi:hypothetical protein
MVISNSNKTTKRYDAKVGCEQHDYRPNCRCKLAVGQGDEIRFTVYCVKNGQHSFDVVFKNQAMRATSRA